MNFLNNTTMIARGHYNVRRRASSFTNKNLVNFKSTIKYLNGLRESNYLSENDFAELVTFTSGLFIGNEVNRRVKKTLRKLF